MAGENNLGTLSVRITGDIEDLKRSLKSASTLIETFTKNISDQLDKFNATIKALGRLDRVLEAIIKKQSGTARILRETTKAFVDMGRAAQDAGGRAQSALGRGFQRLDPGVQNSINSAIRAIEILQNRAKTTPQAFQFLNGIKNSFQNIIPGISEFIGKLQAASQRSRLLSIDTDALKSKLTQAANGWVKNNIEAKTGISLQAQIGAIFRKNVNDVDALVREIDKLVKASRGVGQALKHVVSNSTSLGRSFGHTVQQSGGVLKAITGLDLKLKDFISRVVLINVVWKSWNATLRVFRETIESIIKYDQALKNIQAITNATAEEILKLDTYIRALATQTAFSPVEIANAFTLLGQAGFSAAEGMSALQAVSLLATGTLSSVEDSVNLLTTAIRAFGLSAEDSMEIVNLFVGATNRTKLSIESLNTAFNFAGSAAHDAGLSVADTAAALGIMADNGIKASTQGTGLRQVVGNLIAPTKQFRDELRRLNINVNDINPLFNDFGDVLLTLKDSGFLATSAFAALEKRTAGAFGVVVKNAEVFNKLRDDIQGTSAAVVAAEIQLGGLEQTSTRLRNRLLNLFNTKDAREFFKLLLDGLEGVIDKVQIFSSKIKLLEVPFLGGNIVRLFQDLGTKISNLIDFLAGRSGLIISLSIAYNVFKNLTGTVLNLATAFSTSGLAMLKTKAALAGISGIIKGGAFGILLSIMLELVKAFKDAEANTKTLDAALTASAERIAEIEDKRNKLLERRKFLLEKIAPLEKTSAGRSSAEFEYLIQLINQNSESLANAQEDLTNALKQGATEAEIAIRKTADVSQEFARKELEGFQALKNTTDSIKSAYERLARAKQQLGDSKTDRERANAIIEESEATKRLVEQLKQLDPTVSGITPQLAEMLDLFSSTEIFDLAGTSIDELDKQLTEHGINLVNIEKDLIFTHEELKTKLEAGIASGAIKDTDGLRVKLEALEQTLLAVGNAIQYIGQSTVDIRPDIEAFREYLKQILKDATPTEALDNFRAQRQQLQQEALEVANTISSIEESANNASDVAARAAILATAAPLRQQLKFIEAQLRELDAKSNQARNKLDALEKQSTEGVEQTLKGFTKQIEGNERVRKIEIDNLNLLKEKIALQLRLREITEEEARVQTLDVDTKILEKENEFTRERIRLLRELSGYIYALQNIDTVAFKQSQERADAASAEADALERTIDANEERIGMLGVEREQLSLIDQEWQNITETLEGDVADAIADMVFETQDLKSGISGIGTALKDAFKQGFAASIKEKLHFDTIFKGNMLDLGNFAQTNLGGVFSGIFTKAGDMLKGFASKFSGLFGAAGQTVPGTFAGTMGDAPATVFIPTETFKTPTEMVTTPVAGATGAAAGSGILAGLKAAWPFLAVLLGKEILDSYILPAITSATDSLTKNSEQARLGKQIGGEFFKWAFVMFTGGGLWDFLGLEKIGQLLGSAIGRLFGRQSTTKTFLSKIDDIVEPLLSQAFGTDIRIKASSSNDINKRLSDAGFGKGNKVGTGDNIVRALVGTGQDYDRLKQVQQALSAFGFVLGEAFVKGKGAALSIKLVNAALFSLWQNAGNLMDINLEQFFEGLANKLGSFSFVISNINEEMERLNKKIEKGKSVNPEIYKELENAIEGAALIFANEFPKGVDVAAKAIRQLRTNGKVDLEQLSQEINQVVEKAASALKSTFDESLKQVFAGTSLDNALETFKEKFDEFIKTTIFDSIIDAGINKAVTEGVITPLIDGINELQIRLQAGEIDFKQFASEIRRIVVRDVLPAMDIMRDVFSSVFGALASSIGIPLEELGNLFGEGGTFLMFSQDTVDKGKQFTQTWIEAANAITDFYDVHIGQFELQDKIVEKQQKIQELQEEYDRSGGRETYRKELQAEMDALQKEIDALQDTIDAINSIDLEQSAIDIKVALINLRNAIGSVEELIAYYSILNQTLEQGIITEAQMQNLLAQGIASLQEELPAAINILELFNAALDENGVLDVNAFRRAVEEATRGFNSLLEAVKQGVAEALSSGDAKKGVDAFAKYVKKTLGDSLLDAFVNAITNQIFMAALGPFFTDIGKMVSDALNGNIGFDDIIKYIQDNMPGIMEALEGAGQALNPLLQAIIDIFTEMGLIDAYNDALDTQDELITKQLDVAQRWEDIFNQAQETKNKILFGEGSSENALAQVTNAQRQLERELNTFRNASDIGKKQEAASNLISLVDQVFSAATSAGEAGIGRFAKGSVAFQRLQAELISVLDEVSNTASTGASQIDLLTQQLEVLKEIADNTNPEQQPEESSGPTGGVGAGGGVGGGDPTQVVNSLAYLSTQMDVSAGIQNNIYGALNNLIAKLFPSGGDVATTNGYTFNIEVNSTNGDAKQIADETSKSLIRTIRSGAIGSEIKRLSKPGR